MVKEIKKILQQSTYAFPLLPDELNDNITGKRRIEKLLPSAYLTEKLKKC